MRNLKNHNLFYIFSLIIIRLLYDYVCYKYIYELMYIAYDKRYHFDFTRYVISFLLYFFSIFTLPNKIFKSEHVSACIIFCLYLIFYMPTLSYFVVDKKLDYYFLILVSVYWFLIVLLYKSLKFYNWKPPLIYDNYQNLFLILFVIISIFTYKFNGFSVSFDFEQVYEIRDNNRNLPTLVGWIKQGFNVIGSVSIIYFYQARKYPLVLLVIILQLLFFSMGMDKAILACLLIALGSLFIKFKSLSKILIYSIMGCLIIPFIEYTFFKSTYFVFFIIRRTFLMPAWMTSLYYDFFMNHDKIWLTSDVFVISKFFPSIYKDGVLHEINYHYFSGSMDSPNTGMFAEAFMHMGPIGILIFPFIIIYLLKAMDRITRYFSIKAKFVFSFCFSSFMLSVPITGGYFMSSLIIIIIFAEIINSAYNKLN